MKRFLALIFICVLSAFCLPLFACTYFEDCDIVATTFVQYDFARRIAGDKMSVKQLIKPGVDIHFYDISVRDMAQISNSRIFLHSGFEAEPWAESIINSLKTPIIAVDISKNIELIEDDHSDEHHSHSEHRHPDTHFWLNPKNAVIIAQNITDALIAADEQNSDYYTQNADNLIAELLDFDNETAQVVQTAKQNGNQTLVFGDKFAYRYFLERYQLNYVTAYQTCSDSIDPAISDVLNVESYIKQNNIKIIFCAELSQGKVAKKIADISKIETRVFHTAHNVSKSDFDEGITYLKIMYQNLQYISEALL